MSTDSSLFQAQMHVRPSNFLWKHMVATFMEIYGNVFHLFKEYTTDKSHWKLQLVRPI